MISETVRRQFSTAAMLVAALVSIPAQAAAQYQDSIHGEGFFWGQLAAPLGEFNDHVGLGWGAGLGGLLYLDDRRYAALRAEGSFVIYGYETVRRPLSPTIPFVDVDVTTTNWLLLGGVGPQIFLWNGPIRPYIYGTVGASYFLTRTSVMGDHDNQPIATTTNFNDLNLLLSAGGGLSVKLGGEGGESVHLDLSAVYNHNGLAEYVTKGGLRDLGGGRWVADPIASSANLITYRIGFSMSFTDALALSTGDLARNSHR